MGTLLPHKGRADSFSTVCSTHLPTFMVFEISGFVFFLSSQLWTQHWRSFKEGKNDMTVAADRHTSVSLGKQSKNPLSHVYVMFLIHTVKYEKLLGLMNFLAMLVRS